MKFRQSVILQIYLGSDKEAKLLYKNILKFCGGKGKVSKTIMGVLKTHIPELCKGLHGQI